MNAQRHTAIAIPLETWIAEQARLRAGSGQPQGPELHLPRTWIRILQQRIVTFLVRHARPVHHNSLGR